MLEAFTQAKEAYLKRLKENGPQARDEEADVRLAELVGDPLPVGVKANRKGLEQIIKYAQNQQIIKSSLVAEDLFSENTRDS